MLCDALARPDNTCLQLPAAPGAVPIDRWVAPALAIAPRGHFMLLVNHSFPPRARRGFTLLEMLAVIVLLGIVGVIVARSVSGRVDTGKWDAGKIGVTKLDQDVQAYALDNGSPPKALDDLITKPLNAPSWNGPYAKPADLRDPFGHPYGYVYPGQHGQYDIIFYGRDGKPGGEGIDRDYGNWQ